jgi:hypothetical protein
VNWNVVGFAFILLAVLGPVVVVLLLGITNDDDDT